MIAFDKDEIKDVWIEVTDRDAESITISAATFEVFTTADVSIQAVSAASINDNTTISPDVYGLVDTTTTSFSSCNTYYVLFSITIGSEIYKYKAPFKVT